MSAHPLLSYCCHVNSIRIPVKRHSLATFIVSRHLDVIGLQETHWETEEESKTWARDFPTMDLYSSFGTSKQNGVTIAIAKRLRATVSIRNRDTRGRFLSLNIDIDGCSYTVSCLYSPRTSRERDVFLSTVVEPALTSRRHVLLGDFNTVFDPALHRNASTYFRPDPSSRQLTIGWSSQTACAICFDFCIPAIERTRGNGPTTCR